MIYNQYIHKVLESKKIIKMNIGYFFLFLLYNIVAFKNKKNIQTKRQTSWEVNKK